MISIFGFGVASPIILGVCGALSSWLLVRTYRRKGSGAHLMVGSLFIFKRLPSTQLARQKFNPPYRFYFELLLSLLLALGVAGLFRDGPEIRRAILVDNSLSMSAKAPRDPSTTLLGMGLQELQSKIYSLEGDASYDLYVTSPSLTRVADGLSGPGSIESAANRIEAVFSSDRIEDSLSELARQGRYDLLLVVTDRDPLQSDQGSEGRISVVSPYSEDSSRAQNIGIVSGSLTTTSDSNSLSVQVIGTGTGSIPIKVSFYPVLSSGEVATPKTIEKTLSGGRMEEITTTLPTSSAYEVVIEEKEESLLSKADSLPGDNSAWFVTGEQKNRVYFVSDQPPASFRLTRLSQVRFEHVKPSEMPESWFSPSPLERVSVIFYKSAPERLPRAHSLFLLPPAIQGADPTFSEKARSSPQVTLSSWESTHPLLRYAELRTLAPRSSLILQFPVWATPIISSTEGPLAAAGSWGGFRYAALGIEILPYEGTNDPLSSILLLNALGWLSEATFDAPTATVGNPLPITSQTRNLSRLRPTRVRIPVPSGVAPRVTSETPGLYRIERVDGETLSAVNFFNEDESRTDLSRPFLLPQTAPRTPSEAEHRSLGWWIALLALIALGIDTLLSARQVPTLNGNTREVST